MKRARNAAACGSAQMCSDAAAAAAAAAHRRIFVCWMHMSAFCLPSSRLACQSVSQRTWKKKTKKQGLGFSVWVAGICLSAARAFPLYFYVCLSAKLDSWKCLPKERSLASWAGGLPAERRREERERARRSLRVVVIAGRPMRWPPGSAAALRQTRI